MTFQPVLPWWIFIVLAVVIVVLRMYTLYRVLVVVGGGSQRKVVLRWSLLTLAIVCVFAAAARPGIEPTRHVLTESNAVAAANSNVNVFFVVDRSINSRAEDYGSGQFRMAGIRADMDAIVNQYPQGRFSITSFATGARVDWPLSEDIWSLRALLKGYSAYVAEPDSVYRVQVAAAGDELKRQLELARQQYPGSSNIVFYLGEGAGASRQPVTRFDIPGDLVDGGAVLGYGTPEGGRVASQLAANGDKTYFQNAGGTGPFLSILDERSLKDIADQLHVRYVHRIQGDSIAPVIPALDPSATTREQRSVSLPGSRTEFYWVFTGIAMALMFYELFAMVREYRMSRITKVRPT
ncbi:vWA domain-containing protein [Mycobacteroides immunogenum]|uniref:VWFA domain-containing protein n=1 Tax=Mycobacteroides immunogenum TaxID=83262 RepID=A0A7V8RTZ9_9MYCO|nr:VWA domain-containing protein [Mycobacteroides immunogenum]AMT69613.1 hypothetical protein ABG82_03920 [Mycobacteroides immunogenum]ANO02659.1 hypothetical protein BAB75_03925 [Mycobacteroides immunogenum]KIU37890.1 hypothetical protein TL11_25195 [Mycobacteroides immunogenum]KPG02347.1 hypothetical protein AN908_28060 [Mycobacteroides immunogenum]KPG02366.1 hypothetical protein AN909_27570 [Mycobacteroides immunogenum]